MDDFVSTYIFDTEENAEKVLGYMLQSAHWYGIVLMSDFKEFIDTDADVEDKHYGWLEDMVIKARVVQSDSGYRIDIYRALPIC